MELTKQDNLVIDYKKTNDILKDACTIIDKSKEYAYKVVDISLLQRNWLLEYRIAEEELKGKGIADYGSSIIKNLSKELTKRYGKGFDSSNLYKFYEFYKKYPNILDSLRLKCESDNNIVDTLCRQSRNYLSWTHYRILLQVEDEEVRTWYENEALKETWSVRTLQRNISSQYYYRLLKSQKKELVHNEMKEKNKKYDKLEFIKNPIIAEFLGFKLDSSYTESDLEKSIIDNIQSFLMELGKGYAFVGRQYHIKTEKEDYYIDLVFYNYILKCFVLIDLKTSKIRHQDVGQMDMYVRMFDELKKNKDDNPTIGIILCSDTDNDIARYSILNDKNNLYMSKYKIYLPTEEELKKEIENQKTMFYLN